MKIAVPVTLGMLCLFVATSAGAEERFVDLKEGMSTRDALKLWGEPKEREEHETKRREIWIYQKGGRMVIQNGKVVSWTLPQDAVRKTEIKPEKPAPIENTTINPDTRDLVREIAKEVPSGPDVPGEPEPPTGNANNTIQQVAPPLNNQPLGLQGVQVLPPVDDIE